ncbi:MAG: bifunctional riboflavin kinase/FAD synthetase [Gammaproteobacteria bacterium]
MELIRGLEGLRPRHRGCVATIGNYDGVHLGHRRVLTDLVKRARRQDLPAVAVVFEPAPQEYLAPASAPARLMTLREKFVALAACGLDRLLCLRFNAALAALPGASFIERVLVRGLAVKYLAVGDDFRFGHDRHGDFTMLQTAGAQYGFEVRATPGVSLGGERVSSTRIRACLDAGEMRAAAAMLGTSFTLSGRVMYGERLGRRLGFPTANIALKRRVVPVEGIFVAAVQGASEGMRHGAAYVGRRPALQGSEARLEVFVFDFDGDIYGRRLRVELLHRLRSDRAFASLDALKTQIAHDVSAAREWLRGRAAARQPGQQRTGK